MQKASLGTVVTAIASTLGAMHNYAQRLEQNGEKITEIDRTVFAQSRCESGYSPVNTEDTAGYQR